MKMDDSGEMHGCILYLKKVCLYNNLGSEMGYSTVRPQVPTRKKIDLLERKVT